MRFIGTTGHLPYNTDVDIIHSEDSHYSIGKKRILNALWVSSHSFTCRADKVSIIRRKFKE